MPYNVDPNIVTTDFSIGPGVIFIGPSGATPTTTLGAIGEDGVTLEIESAKVDVRQGNPDTIEHSFNQTQNVKLTVNALEVLDFRTMQYGLGAGVTAESATLHTFTFGGSPSVTTVALQVDHSTPAGGTLSYRIWKARADGPIQTAMGKDVHRHAHAYMAMRSSTNWGGTFLASNAQLLQVVHTKP